MVQQQNVICGIKVFHTVKIGNLVIEADGKNQKIFSCLKFSEENNGVDFEKKIPYYAGMFDKEAGILRGHIAKRDSRQRGYEIASTANGVLNFYPY